MGFQISPFGNDQFFNSNGALAVGYKLYIYLASTSQKEAVYQDVNGVASHTNPIILNSIGMPPAPIFLSVAKRYKFVYTTPTDTDPPSSPLYTVDEVDVGFDTGGVPASEWVLGTTPTFISTTQFSVVGDQRSIYHVGRRVQVVSSIGVVFGTISASVFGAATTVTLILDSGVIDTSISSVYYGFLSALGSSWPSGFNTGLATSFNGDVSIPPASNFNLIPVGVSVPFAGANLPPGYLWANGDAVSRTQYPSLFGAIGTVYGSGDGATTFNLPDLRGRFPLGKDDMGGVAAGRVTIASLNGDKAIILGGTGGEQTHILTVAELAAHPHSTTAGTATLGIAGSGAAEGYATSASNNSRGAALPAGGDQPHNNMPPWLALNFIIRYA